MPPKDRIKLASFHEPTNQVVNCLSGSFIDCTPRLLFSSLLPGFELDVEDGYLFVAEPAVLTDFAEVRVNTEGQVAFLHSTIPIINSRLVVDGFSTDSKIDLLFPIGPGGVDLPFASVQSGYLRLLESGVVRAQQIFSGKGDDNKEEVMGKERWPIVAWGLEILKPIYIYICVNLCVRSFKSVCEVYSNKRTLA